MLNPLSHRDQDNITDPHDSPPPFKSLIRPRAPLLWLLIPCILGILLQSFLGNYIRIGDFLRIAFILFTTSFIIHLFWRKYTFIHKNFSLNLILLALGFIFLSAGYTQWRAPQLPSWPNAPARESTLTLKIDRLFTYQDPYHRQSGLGTIIDAPTHLKNLIGQHVSFFLKKSLTPNDQDLLTEALLITSQIWQVRGILEVVKSNNESFSKFLLQNHIYYRLSRGDFLELKEPATHWQIFCARKREQLTSYLLAGSSEHASNARIYAAMLLGQQSLLSPEQKTLFSLSGTIHLFAISGLHIAVIASVLFGLFNIFKINKAFSALLGLSILFTYIEITGAAPSAMRAFIMVSFLWSAKIFHRESSSFAALVASACIALIIQPTDLFNVGFQLSYTVVASILLYGLPLAYTLKQRLDPYYYVPHNSLTLIQRIYRNTLFYIINALSINISALLISTPLIVEYFHLFTPGSLFSNLLLVPISSLVIVLGMLTLSIGLIGFPYTFLGTLNKAANLLLDIMHWIVEKNANVPGLFFNIECPMCFLSLIITSLLLIVYYIYSYQKSSWRLLYAPSILFVYLFMIHR